MASPGHSYSVALSLLLTVSGLTAGYYIVALDNHTGGDDGPADYTLSVSGNNITNILPTDTALTWLLNENTGTSVADTSGNNLTGTLTGGWAAGINGPGL